MSSKLVHFNQNDRKLGGAPPKIPSFDLKGQCHEIFLLQIFFMIYLPQAPENNTRVISNFFKNSRKYSQVKVHQRYQLVSTKSVASVIPVANLPLVSALPAANLPPVSTTPVANIGNTIRLLIT